MDEFYLNRRLPIIIFLNCLQSLPNKNAAQAGDQNKLDHFSNKGTGAESCGWWIIYLLFFVFIDINFKTGHLYLKYQLNFSFKLCFLLVVQFPSLPKKL